MCFGNAKLRRRRTKQAIVSIKEEVLHTETLDSTEDEPKLNGIALFEMVKKKYPTLEIPVKVFDTWLRYCKVFYGTKDVPPLILYTKCGISSEMITVFLEYEEEAK